MTERNENRRGYKRTEVGWIPEEWDCPKFGTVFDIQLGKMLNEKARLGSNQKPYLANYNIRWGTFDLTDVQTMHFSPKEEAKFELHRGDLLVCEGGEVGRSAIWDGQISPCFYQKALHRLRPQVESINVRFVHYFLTWAVNSPLMIHFTGRTSIAHFTREQFVKFPLPLPSSPEQERIAEVLSAWDRAIEQIGRLIQVRQRLKKGLMQQLHTGKRRFRESQGEWQEASLSQLFERVVRPVSQDVTNVLSISAKIGFERQEDKFSKVIAGKSLERYTLLRHGEFAYNKGNSKAYPQGCIYMLEDYDEAAVPNVYFCFAVRDPSVSDAEFYKFYFEHGMLNRGLRRYINSGVRNDGLLNLYANDFFKLRVRVPPLQEQRKIAAVLNCCDREITQLGKQLDALRQQKKGLMQELLTGQIRVKCCG